MSDSKNGVSANTTKNGTTAVSTKSEATPVVTSKKAVSNTTEQVKTLQDVFENLEQGNRKRKFYQDFCGKLDDVKRFRSKMDGSALTMLIKNEGDEEIKFTSLQMITDFIDDSVKKAEQIKSGIENDLLEMAF
jgi:archaellum component FlaG (FlaF/FlaG flagellin family)